MKRIVLSSALLAALAAIVVAATAQARSIPPGPTVHVVKKAVQKQEVERTGTATSNGMTITVTSANGKSITCAVPAGLDVTPFLVGQVKAECKLVKGVLTVRELEAQNGARAEVERDGTIEVKIRDNNDENDENHHAVDDNRGPGSNSSGPGSGHDQGLGEVGGHHDSGGDHSGHGGGGGDD